MNTTDELNREIDGILSDPKTIDALTTITAIGLGILFMVFLINFLVTSEKAKIFWASYKSATPVEKIRANTSLMKFIILFSLLGFLAVTSVYLVGMSAEIPTIKK